MRHQPYALTFGITSVLHSTQMSFGTLCFSHHDSSFASSSSLDLGSRQSLLQPQTPATASPARTRIVGTCASRRRGRLGGSGADMEGAFVLIGSLPNNCLIRRNIIPGRQSRSPWSL